MVVVRSTVIYFVDPAILYRMRNMSRGVLRRSSNSTYLYTMALFDTTVNVTNDGVYRPTNLWAGAIGCAAFLLFLAHQLYQGKIPLYAAVLLALLVCAIPIFGKLKYGRLGVPLVRLTPTELIMFLPNDSRGKIRFPLESLGEIQIYGREKRRKYRFLRRDGTFDDLTPMLGQREAQAVIRFLATGLPGHIVVKVCEPQTFFEEVRGDGP